MLPSNPTPPAEFSLETPTSDEPSIRAPRKDDADPAPIAPRNRPDLDAQIVLGIDLDLVRHRRFILDRPRYDAAVESIHEAMLCLRLSVTERDQMPLPFAERPLY